MATTQHPSARSTSSPPPATGYGLVADNSLLRAMWQSYRRRITRAGRWLIGPTFLFGLWGSTSLDHQVHVACLYALSLWIVAALCLPFARPAVRLTARMPDRIGAGETLTAYLQVTHTGRGLDLFVMAHGLPAGIEAVHPQGVPLPALSGDKTSEVTLELRCLRRGVYELPGFRVCSDFPFGLLCAYRVFGPPRSLLVSPRFAPLHRLTVAPGRRYHPGGVSLAPNLGESREFVGSRPFREGDSVRNIDWAATARLDSLIVREYCQEYSHRVAVILDTFVPRGDEARREDFERAVSLAAAVSDYLSRHESLVALLVAGPEIYHPAEGRSLAAADEVLEILACVGPCPHETLIALEPEIGEHLPQITMVMCLFLDWDETRRALAGRLGADGAAVKVVVIRDAPPTLDSLTAPAGWGYIPVVNRADFERDVQEL